MADTTKTIKNASNSELSAILYRVRREKDCLQLLKDIQAMSTPNERGPFPDWEKLGPFSTETIVYDGKSIKQMTDQELSEYFDRLRNESELINVIQNIQRYNKPIDTQVSSQSIPYSGLDLNTPIDDLYHKEDATNEILEHFGIPGMKWGVRRAKNSRRSGSEDYQKMRDLKKKGRKNLSNAELKAVNERLQLERSYKDLNPNAITKGKKFLATTVTVGTGLATLYALSNSKMVDAVKTKIANSIIRR